MKEKNIILDNNKVQKLIQEIRNLLYPKEEELLRYMKEITINLDKNVKDGKNIPFCLTNTKIINQNKKNRQEQYIIFTTLFQLIFLDKAKTLDGKFKCARKNYKLLDIISYIEKYKNIFL